MSSSKLLKDLTSSEVDLESVLFRLKVILMSLNSTSLVEWIDNETQGYVNMQQLPNYRRIKGELIGEFLINFQAKYNNASVPIESLVDKETAEELRTVKIDMGISSIQNVLKNESKPMKSISPAYTHSISKDEFQIVQMGVPINSIMLGKIISNVKGKLVEIVFELEKEFENLDDLDISSQIDDQKDIDNLIFKFEKVVFEDKSINIGDGNRITRSDIGDNNT